MKNFILFTKTDVKKLLKKRKGETKFGERIKLLSNINNPNVDILKSDVKYVLIGISETIGISANLGNSKAHKTFLATIKVLLNIQSNAYTTAENTLLLGYFSYPELQKKIKTLDLQSENGLTEARKMVDTIDSDVSQLIYTIVKAGKIPILIGGGHNNAYGAIKGASLGLNKPINAINFDAHTDLRALEGRHSGNGFSYAIKDGFLKNYFIFGLHENYTSNAIFDEIHTSKNIQFNTYDDIVLQKRIKFRKELKRAKKFISYAPFGIEIDCDAIETISSSAQTPSGFSVEKTRQFIHYFGKQKQVRYLHICEASCTKKNEGQIGKLLTYFITDFMKALND